MIGGDIEELLVKYLSQSFTNVGLDMPTTPPLPFYLVNLLPSPSKSGSWVTECNLVTIHVFHNSRTNAAIAARALALVMNPWVFTPKLSFTLSNGVSTGIDCFEILEKPAYHAYENPNLFRYCGRYRIEMRMNQTS